MQEPALTQRDTLVVAHLPMVLSIARRVSVFAPRSVSFDDLVAVGNLALVTAATRYAPGEHHGAGYAQAVPFAAFARWRVHGAMVDSFRNGSYADAMALSLADVPEPSATLPLEEMIDASRRRARLRAAAGGLDPRVRSVIERHYGGGECLHAISQSIGVGPSRVSQLRVCGVASLRRRLRPQARLGVRVA